MTLHRAVTAQAATLLTGMLTITLVVAGAGCTAHRGGSAVESPGPVASSPAAPDPKGQDTAKTDPSPATTPPKAPPAPEVESPGPVAPSPAPPDPKSQDTAKIDPPPATMPPKAPPAPPKAPPAPQTAAAPPQKPAAPPLDLASLEKRLRDTKAVGVFTKLALKNQVDDLLAQFQAFHRGQREPTLNDLREQYNLLMLKVLSLLQQNDPPLARDLTASREAIWVVLTDPVKFSSVTGGGKER